MRAVCSLPQILTLIWLIRTEWIYGGLLQSCHTAKIGNCDDELLCNISLRQMPIFISPRKPTSFAHDFFLNLWNRLISSSITLDSQSSNLSWSVLDSNPNPIWWTPLQPGHWTSDFAGLRNYSRASKRSLDPPCGRSNESVCNWRDSWEISCRRVTMVEICAGMGPWC